MTQIIVLVGCGVIGSRHLQAIAKIKEKLEIHVVEPNEKAQSVGKIRLEEISQQQNHEIFWHSNISEIKYPSDLAIIATQAQGRVNIVNELVVAGHKRFLIEKIVCQSATEYDILLKNLKDNNAKAWVDTSRRYFSSYQKIKQFFSNDEEINISVTASYPGLGRDAIHFIDLFTWFSNDFHIKLNGENLINNVFPNPRGKDLLEFGGLLTGTCKNSMLSLTFFPEGNLPIIVQIISKKNFFIIDELNGKIFGSSLENSKNPLEFKFENSSELTTKIAEDILKNDDCLLPTVEDSSFAHKELFRIFNSHLKKILKKENDLCPIT